MGLDSRGLGCGVQAEMASGAAPKLNSSLFTVGRQTSGQASIMPPIFSALPPPSVAVLPFLSLEGGREHCGKILSKTHPYWPLSRCDLR